VIGRTVSHYRIVSHVGAGGMGTVYLAEDTTLNRRVALKFLPPETSRSPDASARLLREARAASALEHPHIGTIYEIGELDGQPFIAMAYYDGETLAARLARGPLPMADVARIVAQAAEALAAAHDAGIVHRDLKPSNLMLASSGHVKVLDFGIAMFSSADTETMARLTSAGTAVGTAAYMSPEQATGQEVDARSDLWSLGVVTREMLTGRVPFEGTNAFAVVHAVLSATPPPIRSLRPDVAPELEEVVARTMVRERDARTITAGEVSQLATTCLARLSSGTAPIAVVPRRSPRRLRVAAVALGVCAVVGAGVWLGQRNANVRWAREQALPQIVQLAGTDKFDDAYRLAQRAATYLPNDPLLAEQLRAISRTATIESIPSRAEIFYRPYGRADEPWRALGRTPIENVRVPRGLLHWKAELAGYEAAEDVGPGPFWPARFRFTLMPAGTTPAGMVRIASSDQPFQLFIPGLDHLPEVRLADYWIDRHEVTNREFKRFVDDGGYRRRELWREPFVRDGGALEFDAAMALLVDTTGRPGPATWEQGTYPAGQDDFPVTGVSWYEAAAFARWAGKSLPTIFHWSRAADQRLSGDVVPASNFTGKGLQPVGRGGLTRGGTTDMAGNVKEWCWNAAGARRYILGGAWNEPVYMFTDADAQSPFTRTATDGFRCIRPDRAEDLHAAVTGEAALPSRDLRNVPPVSDAVFQAWQSVYSFDHGNLAAKVDQVDDASPEWRIEKVSYAAAYGDERIPAYLVLPKRAKPPYQVIVYFPGSGVIQRRTNPAAADFDRINFVARSGRALLYPVYKSTHERGDAITNDYPSTTAVWRDHMVMWSKDVGRSVDYLRGRPDIDKERIGYMGYSWGAGMAPLFLAVEPRLSLALLNVGGFYLQAALPEADPVNFAPRVRIPVLMLNGRFDFFFPTETSQEPMFRSLGTAAEHKRRVVYDASHTIPRNELIKEFVGWMDKYWGAARQH
jgi:serine/threonine protein kinase/dienelactone hydrolase